MLKISELEKYFLEQAEVSAAFLFGSQAKKRAGKISDWDIAVYFRPHPQGEVEWEETEKSYPQADKIWNDLVDILETEQIDLITLNRAPSNIAAAVVSEGIPLVIKDKGAFWDFVFLTMRQAEDYTEFVDSYFEISQRSASLNPRDREKLKKVVDFLQSELAFYDYFSAFSFTDYQDGHKRRDIERWAENMVNSAIDIGEIILASEKKKIPDYYKDVFVQLGLLKEFKGMDVDKFTGWVKLRNILAHEYLDIKWQRISGFIKDSLVHFKSFLESAKKFIS